ncbi:unnamed protein product [Urochloa decumbens]|uniref:KIB1-4 beta-propeller domain-containing protein n=1 Tax=Urochloa decumbens TaxID=240449 RepID=A0ABC9FRS9_9POAL
MMAAAGEEADAASPLDRRLAPLLLFENDRKTADETHLASDGDATLFFYSIPSKQLLRRRVAEMEGHRYWTTPQGWLLMASRSSPATFLWDPFTGARIDLPADLDGFLRGDGPKRCLLSSSNPVAADQDCLVLVVDLAKTVLWHCRLGNAGGDDDGGGRWLKHEYDFAAAGGGATLNGVLGAMRRLTSVGGKFFTSLVNKVVALDFSPAAGPQFAAIPADMNKAARRRPPSGGVSTTELVESQGSVFCVRFSSSDLHMRFVAGVGVFKLDLAAQAWVRAESLGGRAFLVHDGFGASLDPQEVGLKGDCVYYCMRNDKGLYVHDMEHGTTTLRDPSPYLGDHCCTTKFLMPTC